MNPKETAKLKNILEKFPFRRQKKQEEKLGEYTVAAPGNNKSEIQDKTEISQPTIRKIQSSYQKLSTKDTVFLMKHLLGKLKKNN